MGVSETSITLQWNEPPPVLTGYPRRNITRYSVAINPQSGGDRQVVFVPAEAGVFKIISNLQNTTVYDIKVSTVINTEGQGEQTYDIGSQVFTLTTTSEYYNDCTNIRRMSFYFGKWQPNTAMNIILFAKIKYVYKNTLLQFSRKATKLRRWRHSLMLGNDSHNVH